MYARSHSLPAITVNDDGGASPLTAANHAFTIKTYRLPTQCDHCQRVLWGISKQGYRCADCGVNVHRRCMDEILTTGELCSGNMSHASSSTLSQQESATTSSSVDPIHPGDSVSDDEDVHVTKLQEMDFNNDGGDALYNENGDDLSDGGLDTAATSRYLSATQGANDRVFARNSVSAGSTPDASRRGNTVPSRRTRHLSATSTLSSATTTSYAASVAVSPSGSAAGGSTTADRSLTVVNGKPRRRIFSSQKQRTLSPTNMSDDGLGITGLVTSGGGVPFTPTPPPSAKRLGGVLRDFIQTTAEKSISMDKLKAGPPRLNVFTTLPKNFTRFVMKVGPLAAFQDRIERIIRWDTPSETLFAMSVFMTVCMNPQLLIFVPQLLVIAVIVRNYYAKARRDIGRANGQKLRKSESRTSAGKPVKASQFRPDEIHYRKNMQFIQNTMGMYCDVYENLRLLNTRIDWTDERNTALVLQLTVLSTVIAILGYWFIPWRMVIMTMGLLAFLANTAVGLATQTLFIKYAQSNAIFVFSGLQRMLGDRLKSIIGGDTATEGTPSTTVLIEVVENQRWWAGLNWIPHLLRNERASWSSLDGQLASKPMSEMLDPSEAIHMGMGVSAATNGDLPRRLPSDLSTLAWRWVPGSTWTLDQTWVTASNKQALVDKEGWVYSDHDWTLTKKKRALLTRRRRWVRPAYVADVTGK